MRLQRQDDVVLRPELGRIVGRGDADVASRGRSPSASGRSRAWRRDAAPRATRLTSASPFAASFAPTSRRSRRRRRCRSSSAHALRPRTSPSFCAPADALQLAGRALRDLLQEHDLARHLEVGEPRRRRNRGSRARSPAVPSRSTTAAATSSPSLSCGMAKVTTCATAGWSISTSSTSRGEIFSPPRLMISFSRPVMRT